MTDLVASLQTSLGPAYAITRELGGGGMSRVFVATETALGRQVVVKVLPSETATRPESTNQECRAVSFPEGNGSG